MRELLGERVAKSMDDIPISSSFIKEAGKVVRSYRERSALCLIFLGLNPVEWWPESPKWGVAIPGERMRNQYQIAVSLVLAPEVFVGKRLSE